MATILVVDDMAVFREPIAAALQIRGHETICVSNGQEALRALAGRQFDLILLDVAMPVMDGVTFLHRLRERPESAQPPVILLTAIADRDQVIKAGRLGVKHYLLKTQFSLKSLFERVEKALNPPPPTTHTAASENPPPQRDATTEHAVVRDSNDSVNNLRQLKPLSTKSKTIERLLKAAELRAMSPTVTKLLKLTGGENASIQQVANALKQDQALAVKILKLANSSVYTRGEPVELLEKAVLRIGMGQIRQVLLNIAVIENFAGESDAALINPGRFWEHSIGCGLIAAEIAHLRSGEDADLAFTMGLVHDVGRMLCCSVLREEYDRVVETAERLALPLEVVESRLLGVNHADSMDRLLHQWRFPRDLIDPIVFHHLSVDNARHIAPKRLTEIATLALANRLCHALMLGSSGNDTLYSTEAFCEELRIPQEFIDHIQATVPDQTRNLRLAMLAHTASGEWGDAESGIRERLVPEFRTLYVSARPHHDAFRLFCDQLSDASNHAPNLGVLHVCSRVELDRILEEYIRKEEALNDRLPLLVICTGEAYSIPAAVTAHRKLATVTTPVRICTVIEAINDLFSQDSHLAEAA